MNTDASIKLYVAGKQSLCANCGRQPFVMLTPDGRHYFYCLCEADSGPPRHSLDEAVRVWNMMQLMKS